MNSKVIDCIVSRKLPRQGRSKTLVAAILEAAIHVLADGGIRGFTTARVAEKAGISVGSLYQYFPNKAAILFQLQVNEWRKTQQLIETILADMTKPPREKLETAIRSFIQSECDESSIRKALGDASPFYRNTPEFAVAKSDTKINLVQFISEFLPDASDETLVFVEDLLLRVVTSFGKQFSEESKTDADIKRYSAALANMLAMQIETYK
ncbi:MULTISPECIES: TetR family transcriptional regulator [Shewanella]|uniref:TetR family transcriptional regulator n=1 Tax=Shewanella TaxID=22 RepID=UPI001677EE9B|nr:TetR family transcriptional regulator [Shewanella fodinae]MCL2906163.1 TetR family transcriptional regulator [Shewanella fodinae]GGY98839.1 TetR family transcriptional regulator [Shewanella fodinae]